MPLWLAGAVLGSAVIGGASSNKAADQQADAAKKGLEASTKLAEQSRLDAINLFNQGRQSRLLGQQGAFNFFQQNAPKRISPLIQGNMMAQQIAGQGGIQANNAILGLPVDMSFANQPQQVQADYSGVQNVQLPMLGGVYNVSSQPVVQAQAAPKKQQSTASKVLKSNLLGRLF